MKLVEILARELKEWPENINELTQSRFNNEVYVNDEDGTSLQPNVFLSVHHNEGKCYPAVTRSQWEAERARIAELARGQDSLITTDATPEEWRNECQKQYEQELWDKAYFEAWTIGMKEYASSGTLETMEILTTGSAALADAFMAERAKRMKGVK